MSITQVSEATGHPAATGQSSRAGPIDAWALMLSSLMAGVGLPVPTVSQEVTPAAKGAPTNTTVGVTVRKVPNPTPPSQGGLRPTGVGTPGPVVTPGPVGTRVAAKAANLKAVTATPVAADGVQRPPPKSSVKTPQSVPGATIPSQAVAATGSPRPVTVAARVKGTQAPVTGDWPKVATAVGEAVRLSSDTADGGSVARPGAQPQPLSASLFSQPPVNRVRGGNVAPAASATQVAGGHVGSDPLTLAGGSGQAEVQRSGPTASGKVQIKGTMTNSGVPVTEGKVVAPPVTASPGPTGHATTPGPSTRSGQDPSPSPNGRSDPAIVVTAKHVTGGKNAPITDGRGSGGSSPVPANHQMAGAAPQPILTTAPPPGAPGPAPASGHGKAPEVPPGLAPRVWQQVQARLQDLVPGSNVQISLDPPNLGHLTVHLLQRGDHLVAKLVVSHPEAGNALNQGLGELKSALARSGINQAQISVVVQGDGSSDRGNGQRPTPTPKGLPRWADEAGSGEFSQMESDLNYLV